MKVITKICLGLLVFVQTVLLAEERIEKLTPPEINPSTIARKTKCTRPMREGRFNISLESYKGKNGAKTIVHCYGHGGSGWTTLWGSVGKAIQLFQNSNPDQQKPIRVIGSGCMGLASSIELTRLGYTVAGITTKELWNIPSWNAAGYFAIVSVKTSPEEEENMNQIGEATFKAFQSIDQGLHPYIPKHAVRYMPVYCSDDTESGVEDLEKKGIIPSREAVTLDFGNGVQHPHFFKYMTYFLDTTTLMKELNAELNRLNIPIEMGEVLSFDDIAEEIIFDCSGLGGRELNQDVQMVPVLGHLILPNEQSGTEHMNYMIYTHVMQDGKEEYVYMFPKSIAVLPDNHEGIVCRSVLGGTFIPNTDRLTPEELENLDNIEYKRMLDRNCMFFHGRPFQE